MGKYHVIYCLQLKHSYYKDELCRCIDISVNSASVELMRRRGLIFKKTNVNEWCLIGDENIGIENLESDILLFDMHLQDTNFLNFTLWPEFNPMALYSLNLPSPSYPEYDCDFVKVLNPVTKERKMGNGFCLVTLNLKSVDAIKDVVFCNVLKFSNLAAYSEYCFFLQGNSAYENDNLNITLREKNNNIEFLEVKQDGGWRFISKKPVPISECYDYHLSLIDTKTKEKLMEFVPHPVSSVLLETQKDSDFFQGMEPETKILRQICYF